MNSSLIEKRVATAAVIVVMAALAACGGDPDLSCDKEQFYQEASEHRKVVAPDDLDALDPLAEMPIPEANPAAARAKGAPCVDRPPRLINVD